MDAGEHMVTGEDERNLARVLRNALREADACAGHASDAEATGNEGLAGFFRDVQKTYASVAERAEEILDGEGRPPAGVRPGRIPAEGDPGDVTLGQEVS